MRYIFPAFLVSAALLTSCGTATVSNSNMSGPGNTNTVPVTSNLNTNVNAATTIDTASGSAMEKIRGFTTADVASHATADSCYAIVAGEVYDLTQWIGEHPGGERAIMGVCGKDITDMTHPGGAPMAEQVQLIPEFKIGVISE